MAAARQSLLHQQALVVMGLFAGFSITVLVVILQSPIEFLAGVGAFSGPIYFDTLVTLIAAVASVCVFGVLATMELAAGTAEVGSALDKFGYVCFLLGLFGVVAILPLLLVAFTSLGAVLLLVFEAILLAVYFTSRVEAPGPKPGAGGPRP